MPTRAEIQKAEADALASSEPISLTMQQINNVVNNAIVNAIDKLRVDLEKSSKLRHDQVMIKLDNKCSALEKRIVNLETTNASKDESIAALTAENKRQAALIAAIDQRLYSLQNIANYNILQLNDRHQRDRGWTCRFSNVLFGKQKVTAELIYINIVVPALQLAVAAGELQEVPSFNTLFDHGHLLYKRRGSIGECWLFRFSSRFYLYKFLAFKKKPLDKVNRDNGSSLSYADATRSQRLALTRAGADMTPFNRALISTLINMPDCGMARISGTGVVVALKADMVPEASRVQGTKLPWHKVLNPFAPDLPSMLLPAPTLASLMSDLCGADNLPACLKPAPVTVDDAPEAAAVVADTAGSVPST